MIKTAQMASSTSGCNDINIHDTDQLQSGGAPVPLGVPTEGGTPLFPWFIVLHWQVPRKCLMRIRNMSCCKLAETKKE